MCHEPIFNLIHPLHTPIHPLCTYSDLSLVTLSLSPSPIHSFHIFQLRGFPLTLPCLAIYLLLVCILHVCLYPCILHFCSSPLVYFWFPFLLTISPYMPDLSMYKSAQLVNRLQFIIDLNTPNTLCLYLFYYPLCLFLLKSIP